MKFAFIFATFFIAGFAPAQTVQLLDYEWTVTDIASKGLNREDLFVNMDRKFVRLGQSICSNRAHMWANEFKRRHDLDTAKIFLFYTKKEDDRRIRFRTWWYHVAPVVNEAGKLWVMDAGFPGYIKAPLTKEEWLMAMADSTNCKEMQASETELIELMFTERTFPKTTAYGNYDCYYKIVPHTLWTPNVVAENLLGRDEDGNPVRTERFEIDKNELYQACIEATTTNIGWMLRSSKKKCKNYVGL